MKNKKLTSKQKDQLLEELVDAVDLEKVTEISVTLFQAKHGEFEMENDKHQDMVSEIMTDLMGAIESSLKENLSNY